MHSVSLPKWLNDVKSPRIDTGGDLLQIVSAEVNLLQASQKPGDARHSVAFILLNTESCIAKTDPPTSTSKKAPLSCFDHRRNGSAFYDPRPVPSGFSDITEVGVVG